MTDAVDGLVVEVEAEVEVTEGRAREPPSWWQHYVAGTVGGAVGISTVFPLDTAKTRMQTHAQYRGLVHCLESMARDQGVRNAPRAAGRAIAL